MWLRNWSLCIALTTCTLVSAASAQQAIHWQWSLESAKQLAGRTNRLVLVHFWADWCGPCKRMEQEVFSRPDVAATLEADYVPVKIHRDHYPATAQQYGVTGIPADIVLTPQGQVIEKFQGFNDARQYVGRLSRVAAAYRAQPGRMYAQVAPRPADPRPEEMPSSIPAREVTGRPPVAAADPPGIVGRDAGQAFPRAPQVAAIPANPPYGRRAATNPDEPAPGMRDDAPVSPYRQGFPSVSPPSPAPGMLAGRTDPVPPARSGPMAPDQGRDPIQPEQRFPQSEMMDPQGPSGQPWQASTINPGAATPSSAIELPPGNPPLALEGYCPVQLTEKERWVRGSVRWGVRHEGRTYLFAGPEEQRRFYANPERYAPVLSGDDVVLKVEQGQRVPGRREYGAWFQGRVYLFASETTLQKFSASPHQFAAAVSQGDASMANRSDADRPSGRFETGAPWGASNGSSSNPTVYR